VRCTDVGEIRRITVNVIR